MNIEKVRQTLDEFGHFYFDRVRSVLREFLGEPARALQWHEVGFLLETVEGATRAYRLGLLESHLDIFPPKWEAFLCYAYDYVLADERVAFYEKIFDCMWRRKDKLKLDSVVVPADVVADLMAIIPPRDRMLFSEFFQLVSISGEVRLLTHVFDWHTTWAYRPRVERSLVRSLSFRSWEEVERERFAVREANRQKEFEAQRLLRETQLRAIKEQQEADEAERRADEQRRIMLRLLELPADERAAMMGLMREQHVPAGANLRAEEPVKPTVLVVQDRVVEVSQLAQPAPVQVDWPFLAGIQTPDELAKEGQPECAICMTNVPRVVLISCGHMRFCIGCVKGLEKPECPVCCQPAEKAVITF